jgi:site-specific DNA-methyltransferase (adenine-specific)
LKALASGNPCQCDRTELSITPEAKQWDGWGTALKPAHEPIVLARKPLIGTVANNVLTHGTGGLNIDGCRVGSEVRKNNVNDFSNQSGNQFGNGQPIAKLGESEVTGRFPANFIHDGSDEVLVLFPTSNGGAFPKKSNIPTGLHYDGGWGAVDNGVRTEMGSGSAARFFYCAKTSKKDRNEGLEGFEVKAKIFNGQSNTPAGNALGSVEDKFSTNPSANYHPTVKPTDLMRYLVRLITPPNGTVLDPFMGSGSTGKAAILEGFDFIGIEQNAAYIEIARARIAYVQP